MCPLTFTWQRTCHADADTGLPPGAWYVSRCSQCIGAHPTDSPPLCMCADYNLQYVIRNKHFTLCMPSELDPANGLLLLGVTLAAHISLTMFNTLFRGSGGRAHGTERSPAGAERSGSCTAGERKVPHSPFQQADAEGSVRPAAAPVGVGGALPHLSPRRGPGPHHRH